MPRYLAALLDVDGTLVDSNDAHAEAWASAFADHGRNIAFDDIRDRIGKGGDKMVMELAGLKEDDEEGKAIREDRTRRFLHDYAPRLNPFPRTREFVQRLLEGGLKVVIASSAESKELEPLLKIARVDDLIEDQTSSDDAENSKPDPDIVLAALRQTGLPATQVVMVGDTPYDVQAAQRAGIAVIGVRSGGWDDDDLRGAIAVYDDVSDLLDRFEDSPFAATSSATKGS